MQTQDLVFYDGAVQIHISMYNELNICYIFVHDVFNEQLTMRYFDDINEARCWIDSL